MTQKSSDLITVASTGFLSVMNNLRKNDQSAEQFDVGANQIGQSEMSAHVMIR